MIARLCTALVLLLPASPVLAQDIRVQNTGSDPIYNLYVWASDLTPSTESAIVFPIQPGEIDTVSIDNEYSDCKFTFQIDRNSPDDMRRKSYVKRTFDVTELNICHQGAKPFALK